MREADVRSALTQLERAQRWQGQGGETLSEAATAILAMRTVKHQPEGHVSLSHSRWSATRITSHRTSAGQRCRRDLDRRFWCNFARDTKQKAPKQ